MSTGWFEQEEYFFDSDDDTRCGACNHHPSDCECNETMAHDYDAVPEDY